MSEQVRNVEIILRDAHRGLRGIERGGLDLVAVDEAAEQLWAMVYGNDTLASLDDETQEAWLLAFHACGLLCDALAALRALQASRGAA